MQLRRARNFSGAGGLGAGPAVFSEGEMLSFAGIPYFAPDFSRSVRIRNLLKIK